MDSLRLRFVPVAAAALAVLTLGCFSSDPGGTEPEFARPVEIDLGQPRQRIDGFGASSAWTTRDMTEAQADQFFSAETGIGLSLLRVQIRPEGHTDELEAARKAVARGAGVWAAPWSPPGEWKDNGSTRNGGTLLPDYRQAWADRLAAFAATMAAEGVPLIGISAQNEPNYTATWETCRYTPAEMVTFIRDFLGPALAGTGLTVPIIAPETQDWGTFADFAGPILGDPAAAAFVGPLAMHNYGVANPYDYEPAGEAGKALWQTEISDDRNPTIDPGMTSAIRVAKLIHANLVQGGVSAWHYWWLNPRGDVETGNSALTQTGQLTRRGYAMGNWSRFVRPGFIRVVSTVQPRGGVWTTAFHQSASGKIVVVVINESSQPVPQEFKILGGSTGEVTPWITSEASALEPAAPVSIVGGAFNYTLPGRSVTSFVGAGVAADGGA
jgi:glucuronoarabinoxylan endo-1,4-beta-xylanase